MLRSIVRSLAVAATLALPALASAQPDGSLAPFRRAPRSYLGINFTVGQPLGQFSDFIDNGYGVSGNFVYNFDEHGVAGLRIDGTYLNYGNEKKRACLSTTIGCRVTVDVNTSNNIVMFGVGPQISVPSGPIQPYLAGTVGLTYFFTESSVEGTSDSSPFAQTTNQDFATFGWTGIGGVRIPVHPGRQPVMIDFGVRYNGNGKAEYLRKGSIVDNPDGSITVNRIRSDANLLTYHVGVVIGIR
jgi:opacity protein-like surface antigen